jgi:hypothetical protein
MELFDEKKSEANVSNRGRATTYFGPGNCWARPYPLWWANILDTDSGRHNICQYSSRFKLLSTTLEGKVKRQVWGTWCAINGFIEYKILQLKNLINNANYINDQRAHNM